MSIPHVSVLLEEVLQVFEPVCLKNYLDGTLGAGGHAKAILESHPEIETFIGLDQDPTALVIAKERLSPWSQKLITVSKNFSHLSEILKQLKIPKLDGILLDIGVSSMQFDQAEKGFSFTHNGPLDMRMDPTNPLSAYVIVNQWPEKELGKIFRDYGEEKQWRGAAKLICDARKIKAIETTHDLVDVLKPIFSYKSKGINPNTLLFQALRIAVNGELDVLTKVLEQAMDCLAPGGRLAIISFHSLEDRIVKNFFRYAADDKENTSGIGGVFIDKEPLVKMVSKKPITPSDDEIKVNPRSRSAKLRVVEKL